jgi:hypothetical protein
MCLKYKKTKFTWPIQTQLFSETVPFWSRSTTTNLARGAPINMALPK